MPSLAVALSMAVPVAVPSVMPLAIAELPPKPVSSVARLATSAVTAVIWATLGPIEVVAYIGSILRTLDGK